MKFNVPLRVSVAPVQTYEKTIEVEAASRQEAADIIRERVCPGNGVLHDAINSPGWKCVGGRLGPIRPELTWYDCYLNDEPLADWVEQTPPGMSTSINQPEGEES